MEEQRIHWEAIITTHVIEINTLKLTIQDWTVACESLKAELKIRQDVQEQITLMREHHQQMFEAKAAL